MRSHSGGSRKDLRVMLSAAMRLSRCGYMRERWRLIRVRLQRQRRHRLRHRHRQRCRCFRVLRPWHSRRVASRLLRVGMGSTRLYSGGSGKDLRVMLSAAMRLSRCRYMRNWLSCMRERLHMVRIRHQVQRRHRQRCRCFRVLRPWHSRRVASRRIRVGMGSMRLHSGGSRMDLRVMLSAAVRLSRCRCMRN